MKVKTRVVFPVLMTTGDGELRWVAAKGRTSPDHNAKIAAIYPRYATRVVRNG